ncbi:hypothetical protein PVL29_011927 [Vitis rotundifolia]|uniref:Leucine-rich repeat-containing N-terminal plant-type domain-containing protein n=1 Tax=Vitis rotundifolia TaxID=103349 RepID=A0AA38ZQN8_VITRO|nr:hypothetical protein PVL29_011927 [Vitis rotundifolia]
MSLMCGLSMESLSSKYLSWVLLLLLIQICRCKGCSEEEKMGLLEFKAFLKLNNENADLLLPSWIDNNISECCSWERVICDPTTSRVKKLSLNDIKQQQFFLEEYNWWWPYYENDKFWLLNTSLFLPFEELHDLNLSANSFDGFIKNEGFKSLSSLKKLEILDISGNEFDKSVIKSLSTITSLKTPVLCGIGLKGSFPIQDSQSLSILKKLETLNLNLNKFRNTTMQRLNTFTSLKSLSLQSNYLEGFFPIQELCTLENLVMLDLSHNDLTSIFKSLPKLKKLEILNLGYNWFNKTIIKQLSGLTSLKTLVVSNNYIEGLFPSQGFCQLNKLQKLDLSYNLFQGILPPCLNNFTFLRLLDLSGNQFSGNPFSPLLPNLTSLEYIDLSYNQFEVGWTTSRNVGHMIPDMKYLNLSNNGFEGILPSSIAEMSYLRALDLFANNFSGKVPKQLLATKYLHILKLSNNKFHGEIFSRDFNLTQLDILYLDNNQFTGTLSNVISRSFWLWVLDVSNNYMSGEIPSQIGNMTRLTTLMLGNNSFKLEFLDVSHNALSGSLPSLKNLLSLKHLHLQGNMFTGLIPRDFLNSLDLLTLDMRDNRLFGSIPNSISALLEIRILLLRGNLFSGFIPNHLCYLVKYLGPLSVVYNEKNEVEFATKNRRDSYKGGILEFMSGLDLSCNNLIGEIPHELGMLSSIRALNLSHNQLNGSIPKSFSNLSLIESLNLSYNKLGGEIPLELVALNFLEVFSVAYNNFSGRIPNTKAQFGTFDESNYEGNPFLCGALLKRKCNISIEPPCAPSQSFERFATILYINPYWCHRWFNFIEECIYSCYYFAYDSLSKLLAYLYN